jgi:arabinofuranosyltransferase
VSDWNPRANAWAWVPWLVGSAAVALAWRLRFVGDDAFIAFHYARSLVEGTGLTWFGTPVQGYTSFLWVLWVALGMRLGADPVPWSQAGGLAAFVAVLASTWWLARRLDASPVAALVALLGVSINFSVLCFATGGLETMLQTALITVATCQLVAMRTAARWSVRRLAVLSLLLGLGALTRLDTGVAGLVLVGASLAAIRRTHAAGRIARRVVALLLPGGLLVGAWMAWKLAVYGSLLPHAFHAKVDASLDPVGLLLVGRFLSAYWIGPLAVVGLALAWLRRRTLRRPGAGPLLVLVLTWWGYVALVGGDFMEFRFMVPVAPVLFVLLGLLTSAVVDGGSSAWRAGAAGGVIAVLVIGSVVHARTFHGTGDATLDSIGQLATYYGVYPDGNWQRIGAALRSDLGGRGVRIACHGVGAIPYYSRLETLDMWGLNDPDVVAHGRRLGDRFARPGHTVHATVDLLRRRGVHLVIGHPQLVREGTLHTIRDPQIWRGVFDYRFVFMNEDPIPVAEVVAMPIGGGDSLVMWALTPHPRVEELVASGRWESMRLEDVGGGGGEDRPDAAPGRQEGGGS